MKTTLTTLLLLVISQAHYTCQAADFYGDRETWLAPKQIPSPANNPITKEKIALGKKLFFDPLLSKNRDISCMTCHNPKNGWADSNPIAIGDQGRLGTRNSPTIINGAFQDNYFWDGRANSLEEQALGPLTAHIEMNIQPDELLKRLQKHAEYPALFKQAFAIETITIDRVLQAIGSYERTIVSGKSRFDKWVMGDDSQLSEVEASGFRTFQIAGNCTLCHNGFNFSDNTFNNIGINNGDIGRQKVKNRAFWFGAFKTPTLRNISKTAPYFHNGSAPTLTEAVKICAQGGQDKTSKNLSPLLLDQQLTEKQIQEIVLFLKTLDEPE